MKVIIRLFAILFLLILINSCNFSSSSTSLAISDKLLIDINSSDAFVRYDGTNLVVSTGKVSRKWVITSEGLRTVSIKNLLTNYNWLENNSINTGSDWKISFLHGDAILQKAEASIDNDEGFTSKHIAAKFTFFYPEVGIHLQYLIWIYPQVQGIRTQLAFSKDNVNRIVSNQVDIEVLDRIPINLNNKIIHAVGYYSDTQNRNSTELRILREIDVNTDTESNIDWANLITIHSNTNSLILVKESHKTVNIQDGGVNTGDFNITYQGIEIRGIGLSESELSTVSMLTWANWILPVTGNEDEQLLALKKFDRARYPISLQNGRQLMSNTWGTAKDQQDSLYAAREENVLNEINVAHQIGIDVQQIDAGWFPGWGTDQISWRPAEYETYQKQNGQLPYGTLYPVYPDGWSNVVKYSKQKNVKLGIWADWTIPLEDLKWNYDNGGFEFYKFDFANFTNMTEVTNLMNKARKFIQSTNHTAQVNWDVTEKNARVGYFFGREYGSIYLENRKPYNEKVIYIPYLVLRDTWHLAKYLNIGEFQIPVQNIDLVNPLLSDANMYNHSQVFMQAIVGQPIFFQELGYYSQEAVSELHNIVNIFKSVRNEFYLGYVFPIGNEPDNSSWSGFQVISDSHNVGFITLFRQINNPDIYKIILLKFLSNKTIRLTNLIDETSRVINTGIDGGVEFKIENSPDFLFLKYELLN